MPANFASSAGSAEAWGITLNSWRNEKSFVTAVRFDNEDRDYPICPMTVTIINRQTITEEEQKIYKEKEQKILYEKIINKYKRWHFFFNFEIKTMILLQKAFFVHSINF